MIKNIKIHFKVSENVASGRSDDPPLLPGEKVQGVARDVTYLCPFSGPARGGLSVTNYKLYFKSLERDTQLVIEVPLGVVSILYNVRISRSYKFKKLRNN